MRRRFAVENPNKIVRILLPMAASLLLMGQSAVDYTYDNLGRLQTATFQGGKRITYAYDNAGNRTTQAVTTIPNPTCPNVSWTQNFNSTFNYTVTCTTSSPHPVITAVTQPCNAGSPELSFSGMTLTFTNTSSCGNNTQRFTYTVSDYGLTVTANGTVNLH